METDFAEWKRGKDMIRNNLHNEESLLGVVLRQSITSHQNCSVSCHSTCNAMNLNKLLVRGSKCCDQARSCSISQTGMQACEYGSLQSQPPRLK